MLSARDIQKSQRMATYKYRVSIYLYCSGKTTWFTVDAFLGQVWRPHFTLPSSPASHQLSLLVPSSGSIESPTYMTEVKQLQP